MFISETRLIVRYAETDQMGIVHHSNYPIWFEAGRTDFIKEMGIPYSKIEEKGILLPLIELSCKYKSAAKYEDEIIIKTRIKEATYARIRFYYEVFRSGEPDVLTSGETVHALTDKNLKPLNIKKCCPEIYDIICKATEN